MIEAKLGDRAAAQEIEGELASATPRYERGTPELLRAQIAAALGERERAVSLIRQGTGPGMGLWELGGALLGNENLEPLYGYPPFEQLVAPAG